VFVLLRFVRWNNSRARRFVGALWRPNRGNFLGWWLEQVIAWGEHQNLLPARNRRAMRV
jgi:hypothetical protein